MELAAVTSAWCSKYKVQSPLLHTTTDTCIDNPDRPEAISAARCRPGRREPPKHAIWRCGDDDEESFDSGRSLSREQLRISNEQKVYGVEWRQ